MRDIKPSLKVYYLLYSHGEYKFLAHDYSEALRIGKYYAFSILKTFRFEILEELVPRNKLRG